MKKYDNYKDSGVEIGEIPKHFVETEGDQNTVETGQENTVETGHALSLQKKKKTTKTKKDQPKSDASLRDYENIPFLKKNAKGKLVKQTIEQYFEDEVKPHLPNAWIDHDKTKIGYEINFTKYFYEFKPLRSLVEIKADILALEEKTRETEKTVLH